MAMACGIDKIEVSTVYFGDVVCITARGFVTTDHALGGVG
jgi:hypothetical protein